MSAENVQVRDGKAASFTESSDAATASQSPCRGLALPA
jgi:hypothetical protein